MTNQDKHKLYMHMDKELHDRIKVIADSEHRSVSAQIHVMLNKQVMAREEIESEHA